MKVLTIRWQRLVSEGRTCDRCGSTQAELERAMKVLTDVLRPLGIEPRLQADEIHQAAFAAAPGESNRIWIADKPLEYWITADVGSSQCCSVCGESEMQDGRGGR
jgi:hypothetical protein